MMTPREKFENDPQYHAMVMTMLGFITRAEYTPSELREIALLASIMHEERRTHWNWTHGPLPGAIGDAGDLP